MCYPICLYDGSDLVNIVGPGQSLCALRVEETKIRVQLLSFLLGQLSAKGIDRNVDCSSVGLELTTNFH